MNLCKLALEDGTVFTGKACGATGTRTGEVVFNTALTGYQEILTDPSYCGQIVTMTFPLIGNYGVNAEDIEAARPHLAGFVIKALPPQPSNFRATESLPEFLKRLDIIGLVGVDTRALTRRVRSDGALRGVISTEIHDDLELVRMALAAPAMVGANLVERVAPTAFGTWSQSLGVLPDEAERHAENALVPGAVPSSASADEPPCRVVVLDCGCKQNILRHLVACGASVTVAPGGAAAEQIMEHEPDAIVVSNGPGDPAAVEGTVATLKQLTGRVPILGICLGHQMLARALGAETYKLRFGHHGANVPVRNRLTGRIEITSQNHGFAVATESLEAVGGVSTHVNANDGSLEGFLQPDLNVVALQFHPEASPGPHDADHVFDRFIDAVRNDRPVDTTLMG